MNEAESIQMIIRAVVTANALRNELNKEEHLSFVFNLTDILQDELAALQATAMNLMYSLSPELPTLEDYD